MNETNKKFIADLEAMPFSEVRKSIKNGTLYKIGSPNHTLALSWLEGKEAELRDERESETLFISKSMRREVRKDRIIAIVAIIIAAIAAREEIIWFISWLIAWFSRKLS
jgi:hypothetical protein